MDRIAGVGLGAVFVFLCLEVVAQVTDFDVTVDHEALGHILQTRHPQSEMPLRIGDG
jgi:hypothetical protein